jgi:hypothetical protein
MALKLGGYNRYRLTPCLAFGHVVRVHDRLKGYSLAGRDLAPGDQSAILSSFCLLALIPGFEWVRRVLDICRLGYNTSRLVSKVIFFLVGRGDTPCQYARNGLDLSSTPF